MLIRTETAAALLAENTREEGAAGERQGEREHERKERQRGLGGWKKRKKRQVGEEEGVVL